jgi:hypothetical protein
MSLFACLLTHLLVGTCVLTNRLSNCDSSIERSARRVGTGCSVKPIRRFLCRKCHQQCLVPRSGMRCWQPAVRGMISWKVGLIYVFLCYSSDLTSVDLIGTRPDICDAVFTYPGGIETSSRPSLFLCLSHGRVSVRRSFPPKISIYRTYHYAASLLSNIPTLLITLLLCMIPMTPNGRERCDWIEDRWCTVVSVSSEYSMSIPGFGGSWIRWIHGGKTVLTLKTYHSLLHIMICNKDTDVFLILTLPFYGTSSIRKRIQHRFIPDTSRRRFPPRIRHPDVLHVQHILQPIMNTLY